MEIDILQSLADVYTKNTLTWWTTVLTITSALVFILLERIRPYTTGQRLFREGFVNDFILYTIVQSYVLGLVIFGALTYVDDATTIVRFDGIRSLPVWLQVVVFTVVHDFYIYWFHRLQHRHARLWRTHEAHHSTKDVDWLSGSRSHSLEILINQTVEFAPIVLFASPETAVVKGCVDAIWGMWIHANIDVRSGILQYVLNGPEMHRWHHASDDDAHNKNFSTKLAIWDWMFGTAFLPKQRKPQGYGLGDTFPKTYVGQHLHAFRPLRHDDTASNHEL